MFSLLNEWMKAIFRIYFNKTEIMLLQKNLSESNQKKE